MSLRKKFIGDKAFYKMILAVAIPMIVQNMITSFVNLLDNIMVGQMGTAQMSGVAIANQLMFVYNLATFGALSGVGIFTAQYFGAKDDEGAKASIRLKLIVTLALMGLFYVIALTGGKELIALFLTPGEAIEEAELSLNEGMRYMKIILISLPAFVLSQVYGSSIKEFGETKLPMVAGLVAVFVNLIGNYIFIFGNFGAPKMGVAGAAVATVIARYVETGIMMFAAHRHTDRYTFIKGLYHGGIPGTLMKKVAIKGTPLMINEVIWSAGMAAITQSYSTRGLSAVAAVNINSTVFNLFSILYFSFGHVISIFVGQALGSGDMKRARDLDNKIIAFSVTLSVTTGIIAACLAPAIPQVYNVTEEVRALATDLIRVSCICMPIGCLVHSCYFTLRTGGKTIVTFFFDCVFVAAVAFPVSFVLSRFTDMPLVSLYLVIQLLDLIKIAIGLVLVYKGVWINNLVKDEA